MIVRRDVLRIVGASLLLTQTAFARPSNETRKALLVLDMQRDFLEAQGRFPVDQGQAPSVIWSVNTLLAAAARQGWLIAAVYNSYSPWDVENLFRNFAALRDSAGAAFDPRVEVQHLPRFAKSEPDAFSNPALGAFLRKNGAETVAIAGVFAEACVTYTAMGAARSGFRPVVVSDAVASGSEERRASALETLKARSISVETVRDLVGSQ